MYASRWNTTFSGTTHLIPHTSWDPNNYHTIFQSTGTHICLLIPLATTKSIDFYIPPLHPSFDSSTTAPSRAMDLNKRPSYAKMTARGAQRQGGIDVPASTQGTGQNSNRRSTIPLNPPAGLRGTVQVEEGIDWSRPYFDVQSICEDMLRDNGVPPSGMGAVQNEHFRRHGVHPSTPAPFQWRWWLNFQELHPTAPAAISQPQQATQDASAENSSVGQPPEMSSRSTSLASNPPQTPADAEIPAAEAAAPMKDHTSEFENQNAAKAEIPAAEPATSMRSEESA